MGEDMKDQKPPFGLRLPPDLKMWVKMKAKMEGRSMNNLLISLIRQAMAADNAKA